MTKSFAHTAVSWSVIFISGVITGAFAGAMIDADQYFTVTPEINLGNVLQATVTFASAVTVALFIQKLVSVEKGHKDLFSKQLEILLEILSQIDGFGESEPLENVTKTLKKLSSRASFISTLAKKHKATSSIEKDCDFKSDVQDIRRLATYTPVKEIAVKFANKPIRQKDGIIEWSTDRRQEISEKVESFRNKIYWAQFTVNRN